MPKPTNPLNQILTTLGGFGAGTGAASILNGSTHGSLTGQLAFDILLIAVGTVSAPWLAAFTRWNNERAARFFEDASAVNEREHARRRLLLEHESERDRVLLEAEYLKGALQAMPPDFYEHRVRLCNRLAQFVAPVAARRADPPYKTLRSEIAKIDKERIDVTAPLKLRSGPAYKSLPPAPQTR
jgi:hypothetical protein